MTTPPDCCVVGVPLAPPVLSRSHLCRRFVILLSRCPALHPSQEPCPSALHSRATADFEPGLDLLKLDHLEMGEVFSWTFSSPIAWRACADSPLQALSREVLRFLSAACRPGVIRCASPGLPASLQGATLPLLAGALHSCFSGRVQGLRELPPCRGPLPPRSMERGAGVSRLEPWRLVLVLATLRVGGGRWGGPRSRLGRDG